MSLDAPTITLSRPGTKTNAPQHITIPATLGSVRLLNQIGEGGMGVVYRARDQLLGREVAVKFLTNATTSPDDPGFTAFLEGARSAATVQHPSLTTIYHAAVIHGIPYIVMQLVDGPTVSELIKNTGPLNQPEALAILLSVADAIAALHDHAVVHRDIKPSNILLDQHGHILVTDFGLAHRRHLELDKVVAGTPAYMAPEAFNGEVSPRTDVYALGIMAYTLLAGQLPFSGSLSELRDKHTTTALPTKPTANLPPRLLDIIDRAAHKNSVFRYKSASQFLRALQAASPLADHEVARAHSSLLQRIVKARAQQTPAPAKIQSTAPSDYFQRLSTIATIKRAEHPALSPSPPPPRPRNLGEYCLDCGYDRFGFTADTPCPECGQPDLAAQQRMICSTLAASPIRLISQFTLLRRMPIGWWEVMQPYRDWRTHVQGFFITAAGAAASGVILALALHTDFLRLSPVIDLGTVDPHILLLHALFAAWILLQWLAFRYGWLNLLLYRRPDLAPQQRSAIRHAATHHAAIALALPAWLLLSLLLVSASHLLLPDVFDFSILIVATLLLVAALYPAAAWLRTLQADSSYRIFPRRLYAGLLLSAVVVINASIITSVYRFVLFG